MTALTAATVLTVAQVVAEFASYVPLVTAALVATWGFASRKPGEW